MPSLLAAAILLFTAAAGFADPQLPDIAPHRHFVEKDGRLVEVGPRVCDNPNVQKAFNQFHSNVHHAVPNSPGPEQSAPGLHNGFGAELIATGC